MSEWVQLTMFQDPVDEEVRRRCKGIAEREDWRKYVDRLFSGISGGSVDNFCWEFTGGSYTHQTRYSMLTFQDPK